MTREQMLTWLQEGNLTIPSFLFVHYVEMGLNEQELILLLHLQQFQKEGNAFPTFEQLSGRMSISVSFFIDLEWFSASPSDISGIKLASSRSSPIAFIITFLNSFMIKGLIQIVLGNVGRFLRTYVSLYIGI